jgi:very-short-patch-repair endonuclease
LAKPAGFATSKPAGFAKERELSVCGATMPHMYYDRQGSGGYFRGRDALLYNDMTPRELRDGPYRRLFQGIYAGPGEEITHDLRCRAATTFCPSETMVTGRSALTLHGLPMARSSDPVELLIDGDVWIRRQQGIAIHQGRICHEDWRPWHDVRLATPLRAVFDAITRLPPRYGIACADAAVRAGMVQLDALRLLLSVRHDRGVVRARKTVDLVDPRAESPKESELRVLLALGGIALRPQVEIALTEDWIVRTDLADVDAKVIVEYDGAWHGAETQVRQDHRRRRALRDAGWVVVVTEVDLRGDPRQLCERIGSILDKRRRGAA